MENTSTVQSIRETTARIIARRYHNNVISFISPLVFKVCNSRKENERVSCRCRICYFGRISYSFLITYLTGGRKSYTRAFTPTAEGRQCGSSLATVQGSWEGVDFRKSAFTSKTLHKTSLMKPTTFSLFLSEFSWSLMD